MPFPENPSIISPFIVQLFDSILRPLDPAPAFVPSSSMLKIRSVNEAPGSE